MLNKLRNKIRLKLKKLRGEDLETITAKSNKQIEKLQVVISDLQVDAKNAGEAAERLRLAAIKADHEKAHHELECVRAEVLKGKFESLFTVTDSEIETHKVLKKCK